MHCSWCRPSAVSKWLQSNSDYGHPSPLASDLVYNDACRDIDDLQQVLNINVVGSFAVTKGLLPMLKRGSKKTIVNISSDAACLTLMSSMGHADDPVDAGMALSYKASKVALNMGELFCHHKHIPASAALPRRYMQCKLVCVQGGMH